MSTAKYAIISVGTNSCRLLVAGADGNALRTIYHETRGTRIGEGVGAAGLLDPAAVDRTLAAVRDYSHLARGAQVFGIGTSALRDAANSRDFATKFAEASGVELTILTGEEEAAASFAGAVCGLAAAGRSIPASMCVVDVGGGSTEFATRRFAEDPPRMGSVQIGAVRLTEKYLSTDPPGQEEIDRCRQAVRGALDGVEDRIRPRGAVVAVGGTANTAARMLQAFDEEERGAVADIPAADLSALLKATLSLPMRERLRLRGLPAQRADIFPAGLMIIVEVLNSSGSPSLIVCESDLLLGYVAQRIGLGT